MATQDINVKRIVLLGSGSSTGTPFVPCIVGPHPCDVCVESNANNKSLNRRGNPACLIEIDTPAPTPQPPTTPGVKTQEALDVTVLLSEGMDKVTTSNILIDCGKSFREAVVRVFPQFQFRYVDAVVLTHEHADALMGLDDLREVQRPDTALQVHCSPAVDTRIREVFPYLFRQHRTVKRYVSSLTTKPFAVKESTCATALTDGCDLPTTIDVLGFEMQPLPVWHGEDCINFGFSFPLPKEQGYFVYISDISEVMPSTWDLIKSYNRIHTLVIDAVFVDEDHATHFGLPQALKFIQSLKPQRAVIVGMTHFFDYFNPPPVIAEVSSKCGVEILLGYDGMVLFDISKV